MENSTVKYVIGERQVLARMKNGEFRLVKLQIGLPEPVDNRWESEVALNGLYPKVVKVPGRFFSMLKFGFWCRAYCFGKISGVRWSALLEGWFRPLGCSGFIFMSEKLALGIYRHYKGKEYQVIAVARHSETEEELVVYRLMYGDFSYWVRPLSMFTENIELEDVIIPRFQWLKAT